MADRALARRSALHGLPLPSRVGVVSATEAPPATRLAYWGAPEPAGDAFGVPLPAEPCRAAVSGERAALWLGPDEWLLLAPERDGRALKEALHAALAGRPASLVEVGDRHAGLLIEGPRAAELINAGCPLDLDLTAFPVGMVARTLLAKAEIVLWRTAPDGFRIEVARSYAPYVAGLLSEAVRDLA